MSWPPEPCPVSLAIRARAFAGTSARTGQERDNRRDLDRFANTPDRKAQPHSLCRLPLLLRGAADALLLDQRSFYGAWADAVHANSVCYMVKRHRSGELHDCPLGGRIRGRAACAHQAKIGGHVDDAAASAGDHMWQHVSRDQEDTAHVGGHQRIPLVDPGIDDTAEIDDSSVVEQHVDAADMLHDLRNH
jgi:hypothetical protein